MRDSGSSGGSANRERCGAGLQARIVRQAHHALSLSNGDREVQTSRRTVVRGLPISAILRLLLGGISIFFQQQSSASQTAPVFRSGVNLVSIDVAVRDRTGANVPGLTANDFELLEDSVRQQIVTFAFEEIAGSAAPVAAVPTLSAAAARTRPATGGGTPPTTPTTAGTQVQSLTSEDVAGHRLITVVFDTSSMQPEDIQKAADSAMKWIDGQMTSADLVAVASIGSSLQVLTDFTSNREQLHSVLAAFSGADSRVFAPVDSSTASTDEANATLTGDTAAIDASAQELDTFNNDVRLRALKTIADALQPIPQKKAIIYFSSGIQRSGTDNQVELRAAVNAAVRANAAIYPVDSRGLQAVVPGGSARQASRGGLGAFSGRGVADQFVQLAAQQETLTTLASDTGGTAFTDTNDFGEAFAQVVKDISSYYILGFASTNPNKDGREDRSARRLLR
jgi:VWFA-related protein